MIIITVRTIFGLDRMLGSKKTQQITINGEPTVRRVIDHMAELYGYEIRDLIMDSNENPKPGISILVNGRNIFAYNGFSYKLEDKDVILILPPVGGG
ncbi:MAG: MoaD/ThiS family protein [Bacillota bacterium]